MNKNNLKELKKIDVETEITLATVEDLTKLTNQAISAYNASQPIYNELTKKILDTFQTPAILDNLDTEDMIKLLTLTSRNQMKPIQDLTKLVAQVNTLQERMDANKEIERLRAIVEDLQQDRDNVIDYIEEKEETPVEVVEIEEEKAAEEEKPSGGKQLTIEDIISLKK